MKSEGRIVLEAVALSIAYGIAHDLVTAHLWVEYFTVHHAHLIDSDSPIAMALLWGFLATFWVGLFAGALLVVCNRFGTWPRISIVRMRKLMVRGMIGLYVGAMAFLIAFYIFVGAIEPSNAPADWEARRRAMTVGVTHAFSYGVGTLVILGMGMRVLGLRKRLHNPSPEDPRA